MASNLSSAELSKPGREWRLEKFMEKYKKQEEFTLVNPTGKKIKLVFEEKNYALLKSKRGLDQIIFQSVDGKKLKLKDFAKTSEFGGLADKRSTTHIEEREVSSIQKQLDEIKKKLKSPTVPIKIKNKIYEVYSIGKTPGTPKSDFHFYDIEGKEIVWMSHKDGSKPTDFQQWGGISKSVPNTHNHKETKKFIHDLETNFPDGLIRATNVVKEMEDRILKCKSVYGDDYTNNGKLGRNNVSLVLQGHVKIVNKGKYYIIESTHTHENGDILTGDYEPIFNAQYRSDRGAPVKNARASVWPSVVKKRKNTIILDKKKR